MPYCTVQYCSTSVEILAFTVCAYWKQGHRNVVVVKAILLTFILCSVWMSILIPLLSFSQRAGGFLNGLETSSANSTLRFGRIYAISQQGSPRRKSIAQAANVTELQLSIPMQPNWTGTDEQSFRLAEGSSIPKGSLFAWLGHLHALRQ